MIECRAPKTKKEFEDYYYLRWLLLRSPWKKVLGSEKDEFEDQGIHRCIIDHNNNILAVGRLHFTTQQNAQIRYMAVSESAQGQGYGNILLESLENEARVRGAKSIELNARETVLGFYQKLAYKNLGLAHLLYGEIQHYSMSKSINSIPSNFEPISQNLEETWHKTIPLSKAMNIRISHFDGNELSTSCDPLFNKNLHNTMFAGSIYTLATLTGWGWIYLKLEENKYQGDIVLADAKIKYLAPIKGVVCGKTQKETDKGPSVFLSETNKMRFTVKVDLYSGDKVAAKFIGEYVVIKKEVRKC
ncbi:MAG: GNAT family N-acetyltransferase/hotdog fold thioesterase [Colwelliaceae bacterium]|nr:GNAT family N-acetyltransferase/hotdog fold thioesterase [Colwelliaceae bacterium]